MGQIAPKMISDQKWALLFLIAGLLLCAFSFHEIKSVEDSEVSSLAKLELGASTYQIMSNNQCVGRIQTEFVHQKTYELQSKGELDADYNGASHQSLFGAQASFNPLGQLTAARLSLKNDEFSVLIDTHDVNPITMELQFSMGGKSFSRSAHLPGPISLKRSGDAASAEVFQLTHEHSLLSSLSQGRELSQGLLNGLKLEIQQVRGTQPVCQELKTLNLGPVIETAKMIAKTLNSTSSGTQP